ncbi:MAG: Competence protein ComEA helix-hairpin-helix repeat protein [Candidatus Woesebacteria bacterium GW2011_GWB1_39_10]|uniref:Competence protein ComEA helix-hairpin-helix repeat protein n=2 Tax=Candidatus Woeseibacteriota TaxID=1752722 RepID=A0A0G0XWW5_9BACT|nr:MAG: Competence protein ComEA helix-hairpin-helix repeat protein [Candidatus Woesebacteria bacterium GW2011_GWB1_39_10]KKR92407.1 MAG: Competence protein ComEA helix-hairpin-helix repeat protein [Candidatus Woesebacteria bacterium GW2011_GWA1_41_13b]
MQSFDIDELLTRFRYPLLILLGGLIATGAGVFFIKSGLASPSTKVEVLNNNEGPDVHQDLTVEIAGEVVKPGVYKLSGDSRIEDLLVISGGFSVNADRVWTDKYLNRAAKLTDGQKVYIPSVDKQSDSLSAKTDGGIKVDQAVLGVTGSHPVNINTASLSELDTLPGIGQVYGQNIIEHRPYSTTGELVSKGAIKQSLYEKIKDRITVY